jgi:catechol 2,3-dioxygenase-like lactoylglutathione lyase family enzyme
MIKGIKFVTIPVRDQDRALAFYTEKLGFTVATDQPFNDEQRWIELKLRGVDTRIVLFMTPDHEPLIGKHQPVAFYSADVKRTYDELSVRGVPFAGPPEVADWGSSAVFSDPDGNKFVISSK